MPKTFAITGVAGFVAPRHLKAIRDVGGELVAALDPHDAVGILDQYFPDTRFFVEFERFDRHLEKLRRQAGMAKVDYLSICSPNYLHDAHIRAALRIDADAICEKPLVLNPWNLDALQDLELETGRTVYNVLQLRVHPVIQHAFDRYTANSPGRRHNVRLTYITSRGNWYATSWKGHPEQSGGLATNIGIHFFDVLGWIFGKVSRTEVHHASPTTMSGFLELQTADVEWFLSIDSRFLPPPAGERAQRTFRSLLVDGDEIEFSGGFTDLHTIVYQRVLAGRGARIDDARSAIELAHQIRTAPVLGTQAHSHPLLKDLVPR
jgi:UDP-N-acetyl-2-amino-2-deoxyglucuronate dehydrogenase